MSTNKDSITIELRHSIEEVRRTWTELDSIAEKRIANGEIDYIQYSFYQTFGWNLFVTLNHNNGLLSRLVDKRQDYIVVFRDGNPFAIIPLLVSRLSHKIEILSGKTAGILNAVSPYHDSPEAPEVFRNVAEYLRTQYKGWKFKFNDMPRQSQFANALAESFHNKGFGERGSYHVDLKKFDSFDSYMSSLSKNMYKNIRKSYNHIVTDQRTMQIRVFNMNNLPTSAYLWKIWRLYFLRKLAWKHKRANLFWRMVCNIRGFKEAKSGLKTKSIRQCPEAELVTLEIDNQLAAFMLLYRHGKYLLMPKLAIDTKFSRYSPGILIIMESMKRFFNEGMVDFDMCRGDERYKREVGGINAPLCGIIVKNK
ncbi:MAG: GNAT family N-acetyltransferase [Firmicutes bacterium]|nr:GNAT family N-acetyltransferase [Bacillota bacterium]MCM1477098.1 GNAT family N-acetyltransferase [Bacteroides sp.]